MNRNLSVIKETEENDFSKRGTLNIDIVGGSPQVKTLSSMKKINVGEVDKYENFIINEDPSKDDKEKNAKELIKKNKKTIKEVVPELYGLIGLISVQFKIDDLAGAKYQPWDVVSLSEGKVMKYYKSERDKLIEFTLNSFLRVYPSGTRIDSSNYDPVKSWICGGQLVSLNLQSLDDDYTLLNHLFFKINNEKGYVLKPTYLRNGSILKRDYIKPVLSLSFNILSGIMLQNCMNENSTQLYVTVKVIGTYDDDKNPSLTTGMVSENFLHPIFKNSQIKFSIYEEYLSFLLLKVIDNNGVILARSVMPLMSLSEGFRNILLYNDHCEEIASSILVVKTCKMAWS